MYGSHSGYGLNEGAWLLRFGFVPSANSAGADAGYVENGLILGDVCKIGAMAWVP